MKIVSELQPEDIRFSFDEQYSTASWMSVVKTLGLVGNDLTRSPGTFSLPPTVKHMAKIAARSFADFIPFIDSAIKRNDNVFTELRRMHFIQMDGTISPDFSVMTFLYESDDAIGQELFNDYDMIRFNGDIDLLASTNYQRLQGRMLNSHYTWFDLIKNMQRDNDFYLGLWDKDRQLGLDKTA